ncbi:MAG: L-fuculose-phosphate aldolase [Betaproteobacteria bacterium]|nr:L-fuculose-phosphate aldolase [Betaproteobacteria bacterium]
MAFLKLQHTTDESLRAEIVHTTLKMNALGINEGKSGNVSARVDAGFLVTPTGIPYEKTRREQIVAMRMDGTHEGDVLPSSEWRFHRDIYAARADVNAIVHTHAPFATTLACMDREIPSFHYMVAAAGGKNIRCAPYATFGTQELSDFAVAALCDRKACLLSHHGMIACGPDLEKTLALAVEVETLARMYWQALQIGEPVLLSDAEMEMVLGKFATYGQQTA